MIILIVVCILYSNSDGIVIYIIVKEFYRAVMTRLASTFRVAATTATIFFFHVTFEMLY